MTFAFSSVWFLSIVISSGASNVDKTCNYVYLSANDDRYVYSTDTCMHNGIRYIKYHCSPSNLYPAFYNYTIIVESYLDDNCSTLVGEKDLNEYMSDIISDPAYNISISYACQGFDSCYVHYLDRKTNCSNDIDFEMHFAPINTCVNDNVHNTSFKYECESDSFSYAEFSHLNCISSNVESSSIVNEYQYITECGSANESPITSFWQFQKCHLPPTVFPSLNPSMIDMPSNVPTYSPTIDIPDWKEEGIIPDSDEINELFDDEESNARILMIIGYLYNFYICLSFLLNF